MSYYGMPNKELSQLIRKTLKENGFTSKDVSVRVKDALYDKSVDVTVKNPLVRLSEVEEIAKRFSVVYRDEANYEILAGCNVYVFCKYECGIFEDVSAELVPIAEKVLTDIEKYNERAIVSSDEREVLIHQSRPTEFFLWEFENGKSTTCGHSYIIRSAQALAVAMWRFKHLGTIYA